MNELQLVLSTFPDLATARKVATLLVERQLAACANLIPQIESIYNWDGQTQQAKEVLVLFKTTSVAYDHFVGSLAEAHPYDVPEIIALPVARAAEAYRDWVLSRTIGS